jgi:hypothetical protein
MLTDQDEEQLAEIKTLTYELGKSTQLVLKRVRHARGLLAAHGPLLAFVHIPKTAGGTATTMFARAYSPAAVHDAGNYLRNPETVSNRTGPPGGWERWHRNGGRVSVGHVPYGVFRRWLPPDTSYMTFLREPVDRVLSHYYRHIHHPELTPTERAERRQEGRATAGSIEEALVELHVPQVTNLATRFLCGDPSPMGELPASALDDAKANLRRFTFVGIQERFEESIVLLQRALGLEPTPYLNRHVSVEGGRPTVEEIPAEQRALIEEHNSLDMELYEFGLELFAEAIAAAEDRFAADVERLRALSADANAEANEAARIWLERDAPAGAVPAGTLRPAAREAGVPIAALKRMVKQLPVTHRIFMRTGEAEKAYGLVPPGHHIEPLIALVHVPGTAGATVKSAFADAYTRRAVRGVGDYARGKEALAKLARSSDHWERWHRRGGRVVAGRVPYALLRQELPSDTRYISFLREPVDRVLSHYYRDIHYPELTPEQRAERRERGRATAASLEEALGEQGVPQLNDLATRFLCGHPSPMGELPATALDDAKANLRELAFVGLQERFDESILLLRRMLGLDPVPHLNANVAINRPAVEDISDEQRALIEEHNRLDAELYAFGLELFEERVAAADEGFAADAEALGIASAQANEEALRQAHAWLDRELPVGVTRPKPELMAAAREADVPLGALTYVSQLVSVTKDQDEDGRTTWTRTAEPHGDGIDAAVRLTSTARVVSGEPR